MLRKAFKDTENIFSLKICLSRHTGHARDPAHFLKAMTVSWYIKTVIMERIAAILLTGSLLIVSACGMQRYVDEQRAYEAHQERLAREQGLYRDGYDRHDRYDRRDRRSRRHSRYVVGTYEVFYDGRPLKDASASTFKVLRDGYAADAWHVYYDGMAVKDASASTFKVLADGYAADAWHVYYAGRRITGASKSSFRVLRDGYAKDSWCVYYAGMKVEDANPGSFECMRDGYARDAWSTFLHGRKIGR